MTQLLAISAGDPAGIGPEIIGKSWEEREAQSLPAFFAIGDPRAFSAVWSGPVQVIGEPCEAAEHFAHALPVLPVIDSGAVVPGEPDLDGARCALQAGFDYMLDQHWGVNFDVKKLFLKADFDATVNGSAVSGKAKLDPWLIGAGITYRF